MAFLTRQQLQDYMSCACQFSSLDKNRGKALKKNVEHFCVYVLNLNC